MDPPTTSYTTQRPYRTFINSHVLSWAVGDLPYLADYTLNKSLETIPSPTTNPAKLHLFNHFSSTYLTWEQYNLASFQALSAELMKCAGGGESLLTTAYFLLGRIQRIWWAPGDFRISPLQHPSITSCPKWEELARDGCCGVSFFCC